MSYISGFKNPSESKFTKRFATHMAEREQLGEVFDIEQFNASKQLGKLSYTTASRHLNLKYCGANSYMDETNTIWIREGDNIYRVEDDLSWVDAILNKEE